MGAGLIETSSSGRDCVVERRRRDADRAPTASRWLQAPPGHRAVTNVIDASNQANNRADTGMFVLDPGEAPHGTVQFTPQDVA